MFQHLKFAVRYWSSLLPGGCNEPGGVPPWVDYSLHPASKLGLHNALLAVHDRLEILAADGGYCDCAVFLVSDEEEQRLTPAMAEKLFAALPHGRIKWLQIGCCGTVVPLLAGTVPAAAQQMPLFAHVHTPYDDLETLPHALDLDV